MKSIAATAAILITTPALADPGHFTQSHGHSHLLALGALALAATIGAVMLWKYRKAGKIAERKV